MSDDNNDVPKSICQVLSFHIKSYKTERDGEPLEIIGADDVFSHNRSDIQTISLTIEEILRTHGLTNADIISITGDATGKRDTGSWDFWMFCRNPNVKK